MSPLPLPASLSLALLGPAWPGGHHTDTEAGKMGKQHRLASGGLEAAAAAILLRWDPGQGSFLLHWLHPLSSGLWCAEEDEAKGSVGGTGLHLPGG